MTAASERLPGLLERWRSDLARWAIPDHILAKATDSPWVLPHAVFARRADRTAGAPEGPSFERARAALDPPGSVLDVGCGAGAACLPLLARATALAAVDVDEEMLSLFSARTAAHGRPTRVIAGRWPDVATDAGIADVVTCHHVLYNVPDVEPFIAALSTAARRIVVTEVTDTHPLASLNPLWLRFHGIQRPTGPTADDLLAILSAMGLAAGCQRWQRPAGPDYASFAEVVEVTRRRLCLAPERSGEVAAALREAGVDPESPMDLGSSGRAVVTIWWAGIARG